MNLIVNCVIKMINQYSHTKTFNVAIFCKLIVKLLKRISTVYFDILL